MQQSLRIGVSILTTFCTGLPSITQTWQWEIPDRQWLNVKIKYTYTYFHPLPCLIAKEYPAAKNYLKSCLIVNYFIDHKQIIHHPINPSLFLGVAGPFNIK
jgi:hypothetical protein